MDRHVVRLIHGRANAMVDLAGVHSSETRVAARGAKCTNGPKKWNDVWIKMVVWASFHSIAGSTGSFVGRYYCRMSREG